MGFSQVVLYLIYLQSVLALSTLLYLCCNSISFDLWFYKFSFTFFKFILSLHSLYILYNFTKFASVRATFTTSSAAAAAAAFQCECACLSCFGTHTHTHPIYPPHTHIHCTELSLAVAHKFQSQAGPHAGTGPKRWRRRLATSAASASTSSEIYLSTSSANASGSRHVQVCVCMCVLLYVQSVVLWPKNPSLACAWAMPFSLVEGSAGGEGRGRTLRLHFAAIFKCFSNALRWQLQLWQSAVSAPGAVSCKSLSLSVCLIGTHITAKLSVFSVLISITLGKFPINSPHKCPINAT